MQTSHKLQPFAQFGVASAWHDQSAIDTNDASTMFGFISWPVSYIQLYFSFSVLSEQEQALVKKFKASDRVPAHASKSVYSSIFMFSRPSAEKESYTRKSTSARGMNMT